MELAVIPYCFENGENGKYQRITDYCVLFITMYLEISIFCISIF